MLIILDNFEHLTAEAGQLSQILQRAPKVKLIVTSRIATNIQGEYCRYLEGMDFPQHDATTIENYSAVRLFVARAQRYMPNCNLQEHRTPIIDICKAVDGMPLAIEMVATWLGTMSCAALAEKVKTSIGTLNHRDKNVEARHSSLRTLFDYSWSLLDDDERRVLRRLSMFRGEFGYDAAVQATGVDDTMLANLIDKSFLYQSAPGVYRFHEMLRHYAEEHLRVLDSESEVPLSTSSRLTLMLNSLTRGDFSRVQQISKAILERSLEQERSFEVALGLALRGISKGVIGDYEQCRQLCEASRTILTPKNTFLALFIYLGLAVAACGEEDNKLIKEYVCTGLEAGKHLSVRGFSVLYLPLAAVAWALDNKVEKAVEYLGLAFNETASSSRWMEEWAFLTLIRAEWEAELGTAKYQAAWERGKYLNYQQVIYEILSAFGNRAGI